MLVPTTALDHTRQSLFRTLFLIALGSSLIAFLLAMAVSNSISGGLGRLTAAAQRISTGETLVRTHLRSEDEIGQLAEAFDVMAESIEDQAAALRRAAQDEAELRARLQSVVAGMGEALVAVDAQGQVTEFNRAAERLVGRRRRNSLGRALAEVLSVQTPGGPPLEDRLRQSANFELTAELSTSRGTVPVLLTAGPLPAEGTQAAGWVLLLRDLRPEREVERMKSEFLSRVGHELRTPLTAILGFSQILAHRPVRPEQARVMHGEIVEQSNRLLRTVQMLEFFASAGANRLGLDPEAVRPRVLLEELRQRWSDKLPPTSMLSIRGSASLPALEVDRRWVGLALDELVDNAVKFGTDVPRVTVGASAVEGGTQLFVADQGPGMTATEAAAAFAEFVQGDSSDTRRFGGLGLGLPLVRRVVEAHGGTVDVVTEPGKGCRVQLFFPRSPGRDRRPSGAGGGRRSPS